MARKRKNVLTAKAYIDIDGEKVLWYEIDENENVTWFLPEDISKQLVDKMLKNIAKCEERLMLANPDSALWDL